MRAVVTPEGGIGLCVDATHKMVARDPLPMHLTRDEFRPWQGRHCIYHYGHKWYDIQLSEFSDLNVSQELIPLDDKMVSTARLRCRGSRRNRSLKNSHV